MSEEKQPTEKRIIIDEDWKAQVQAEKEQGVPKDRGPNRTSKPVLPPASMSFLFSTLATQALIALGLLPNPVSGKSVLDLDQARHFIDTLGVLEEKTRGNLSDEEQRQLNAILFDLRMQYIEAGSGRSGQPVEAHAGETKKVEQ